MSIRAMAAASLVNAGWSPDPERPAAWCIETPQGSAVVHEQSVASNWLTWCVAGGAIGEPPEPEILSANGSMPGPLKFVRGTQRAPRLASPQAKPRENGRPAAVCRADVPSDIAELATHASDVAAISQPLDAWAAALTDAVRGQGSKMRATTEPASPPASLVQWLDQIGWPASLDDGLVRVTVQLPGVFRQIEIHPASMSHTLVIAELIDLTGCSDESWRAATRLALEANDRLYLARMSVPSDSRRIMAEVQLPGAELPGAWLAVSLESIRAAISLLARELEALRSPEVAAWCLAAQRP